MNIEERVDEHEVRLRKLETNSVEMQMQMKDIQKSQLEIKNMLLERDKNDVKLQEKNQEMMQELITNLTESITETVKSNNSDNTYTKKQIWLFLGGLIGLASGIITIVGHYFGL